MWICTITRQLTTATCTGCTILYKYCNASISAFRCAQMFMLCCHDVQQHKLQAQNCRSPARRLNKATKPRAPPVLAVLSFECCCSLGPFWLCLVISLCSVFYARQRATHADCDVVTANPSFLPSLILWYCIEMNAHLVKLSTMWTSKQHYQQFYHQWLFLSRSLSNHLYPDSLDARTLALRIADSSTYHALHCRHVVFEPSRMLVHLCGTLCPFIWRTIIWLLQLLCTILSLIFFLSTDFVSCAFGVWSHKRAI